MAHKNRLLVVLVISVVNDVEELELVNTLGGGNDAKPVTKLLLLEELLGQVLEIAARELVVSNDLNLAIGDLGDDNGVAELANATVDLDLLVQELLEGRDVEDLVVNGLRGVDDELLGRLAGLASLLGLRGGHFV